MADFNQMGGLPTGYADLLNSARQQLVKLPDGSYVAMPQFGQPTSLEEIYGGILPSVPAPLKTRTVSTVPIDAFGNPITASSSAPSGIRPAITQGSQPAGTSQMAAARPPSIPVPPTDFQLLNGGSVQTAMAPTPRNRPMFPSLPWDPFGTMVEGKDQSQLPTDMAYMTGPGNDALEAIDLLTGSGNSAFPRPLPMAFGPQAGGAPGVPMPRNRPSPPSVPAPLSQLGAITFNKGDTVWKLANDRGMTVNAFADLYGIKNPAKIRAGDTVIPTVPMPRMPSPANRTPPQASSFTNPSATHWDRASGSWV